MATDWPSARRAWRSYEDLPLATRLFLAGRLVVLPFGELDGELRRLHGRVLSLGVGYGLVERYLAEVNAGVEIDGVDLDEARIAAAQRTAARYPRVRLRAADVRELDARGTYDAVLAVDILHHVAPEGQAELARTLASLLAPGGSCLVKDIGVRPRWKHAWNRLHDRLVAGPEPIHCRSPEEMAALFEGCGLTVETRRDLGRHSPYPHYLLRLRKSG